MRIPQIFSIDAFQNILNGNIPQDISGHAINGNNLPVAFDGEVWVVVKHDNSFRERR
jgi:hypothetical protein